jgi:hypothetical protein
MACALVAGCQNEATFVNGGTVDFAMTDMTPALVETDEAALYIVETRIDLPIRDPGDAAFDARRQGADAYPGLPFDRLPWVGRDDIAIEIDYTVANMDDAPHGIVSVTLNGFNEFDEYLPGFTIDDQDVIVDYAQWERVHDLSALERESFTVREEQLDEVAVDLATVVNGAPNSNQVVYFTNQSAHDVRSQMYIPAVIPGLIGLRMGIRTEEPANIVVEASVRVRELNPRLVESGQTLLEVTPEIFRPVAPVVAP